MYKCPHATALLEGRAGGIFCRGCGTLFKSFADINPEEKKEDKIPPGKADNGINADDNGNGASDNMAPAETVNPEETAAEPPAVKDDSEETPEDEAEPEPEKPARRGRPKKEAADNG